MTAMILVVFLIAIAYSRMELTLENLKRKEIDSKEL